MSTIHRTLTAAAKHLSKLHVVPSQLETPKRNPPGVEASGVLDKQLEEALDRWGTDGGALVGERWSVRHPACNAETLVAQLAGPP